MPMNTQVETIRFLGQGGLTLLADCYGEETAPPVLLLHGGGQDRRSWRGAAAKLADAGYRAIALDLRGHGDSDWSREVDYSFEAYAADIAAIVKQLGRPAHVAGASLGGRGALVAAAMYPDSIPGLILVDVAPSLDPENAHRYQAFLRSARDGFSRVEDAADMLNALMGRSPQGSAEKLRPYLRQGEDDRLYWRWDPSFIEPRFVNRPREVEELEAYAAQIRQPILMIRAELSEVLREEDVERFLKVAPHTEVRVAPGVGHMLTGDSNDVHAPILIDFLNRVTRS